MLPWHTRPAPSQFQYGANIRADALSGLVSARIVPQEGPRRTLPATKSAAHAASVSGGVDVLVERCAARRRRK